MNKAFIFDMDGVLINSEHAWAKFEAPFFERMFGKDITRKIGNTAGVGPAWVYEKAVSFGAKVDQEAYRKGFSEVAMQVYGAAPVTEGVEALGNMLTARGFKLGLVTQSQPSWTECVVPRLPFKDKLEAVVSIGYRQDLKPKPSPDGYREALRLLGADASRSFVLEDSNFGIAAGKAAGCFVIGYRGNLVPGYQQEGADAYADTMDEVAKIVATNFLDSK